MAIKEGPFMRISKPAGTVSFFISIDIFWDIDSLSKACDSDTRPEDWESNFSSPEEKTDDFTIKSYAKASAEEGGPIFGEKRTRFIVGSHVQVEFLGGERPENEPVNVQTVTFGGRTKDLASDVRFFFAHYPIISDIFCQCDIFQRCGAVAFADTSDKIIESYTLEQLVGDQLRQVAEDENGTFLGYETADSINPRAWFVILD